MRVMRIISFILGFIGDKAWSLQRHYMDYGGLEEKTRKLRNAEYMSFDGYYDIEKALSDAAAWIKKQKHISVYDIRTSPPGELSEWTVDVYFHRLGNEVEQ